MMGGWRDRYRAVAEGTPAEKGIGNNGQPFAFHFGLPVDAAGELPDGRPFQDIRDFKRLLLDDEPCSPATSPGSSTVYATGAPVRFGDRAEIEAILRRARDAATACGP